MHGEACPEKRALGDTQLAKVATRASSLARPRGSRPRSRWTALLARLPLLRDSLVTAGSAVRTAGVGGMAHHCAAGRGELPRRRLKVTSGNPEMRGASKPMPFLVRGACKPKRLCGTSAPLELILARYGHSSCIGREEYLGSLPIKKCSASVL